MIRAVLFDVGGPLDTEVQHEAAIDNDIRHALAEVGIEVDDDAYEAAAHRAVDSFAPNLYKALVWDLTGRDLDRALLVYEGVESRAHERDLFQLRDGIPELLEALQGRGLKFGLVANQPLSVLDRLESHGIDAYFSYRGVSGLNDLRKPDVRVFLAACDDLGVAPSECVMVGDRIDNDVVPAKLLGMRTVLLRTGRHREQQPRCWDEMPDAEATDAATMLAAIERLLADA